MEALTHALIGALLPLPVWLWLRWQVAARFSAWVALDATPWLAGYLLFLGVTARPLLSVGCDLDFERLHRDLATRTRLGSFPVVLAATADQGVLLWVEASLSLSLQQWLRRAAVAMSD